MKVRRARLSEVPEVVKMWQKLMSYHSGFSSYRFRTLKKDAKKIFGDYIRRSIRSRNSLLLVAEDNGKLVGYSLNHIKKNIPIYLPNKVGYHSDLFVEENYRGKGLSRQLLKEADRWFKRKSIRVVSIAADIDNKKTVSIYKHIGMIPGHLEFMKRI